MDGGTTNSIIQYCLSYNNYGAGFGIFQYPGATDWNNNTVRYCISENDGNVSAPSSMLIWNGTGNRNKFQNFEFYNNVVYNGNGSAMAYYDHNNLNFNFRNNIFVSKLNSVYNRINGENFQGNCWFSLNDSYSDSLNFIAWAQANNQEMFNSDMIGMFSNPQLINPGNSNLTDPTTLQNIDDYKVQETSAVIDAGLDLQLFFSINPGVQDFFGNTTKQGLAFDMGVYEQSALPEKQLTVSTSNITLGYGSGISGIFEITSNTNWSIINIPAWLDVTPLSGTNNGTIMLTANTANTGTIPRVAIVTIMGSGVAAQTVTITQGIQTITETNLGNTVVFGSTTTYANRRAIPVTFGEDGEIQSISFYHNGGAGNVLLGVYSDQSGKPFTQLGVTPSMGVSSSAGWQTVSLASPVSVTSGQSVWLAWVFESNPGIRYTTGTPARAQSSGTWSAGMPSTFGASGLADYKYSIYCTYRTEAGAPELAVPTTSVSLGYGLGANGIFEITSNTNWSITNIPSWLDVTPLSGTNNGTIMLTANTANTGTIPRVAMVTIMGSGVAAQTVTITQGIQTITETNLGNTVVFGSTTTYANRRAIPVTFGEDGEIQSISFYHNGGSGNVLLGVYSDQSGKPFTQLGVTPSMGVSSSAGWQTVSLASPVSVTSGQSVWLAWVFESNPGIRYTTGTPARAQSSGTWSAGMPSTFGASGLADYKYSIYCTYRTEAGAPELAVPTTSVSLGYGLGANGTFEITSNTNWSIINIPAWLDVTPLSGTNNGTITLTANTANTGTIPRVAIVTIMGSGVATQTVTITQGIQTITETNLGNTVVFGSTTTYANRRAIPVTFGEDGEIQSISFYHNGGSGNVLLGVYSDQSGNPFTQLGVTPSMGVSSSAGWQTVSLVSPVSVTSGQSVWLAWVFESNPGIRYTTGTPARAQSSGTWSAGMPSTFGASGLADYKYSIYCTYAGNTTSLKDAIIQNINEEESIIIQQIVNDGKKTINPYFKNSVNPLEPNNFKLYPNPAESILNVDYVVLPEAGTRILLIDNTGRTVLNQVVESMTNKIDVSQLAAGLYFLKSINPQSSVIKKFIIQN